MGLVHKRDMRKAASPDQAHDEPLRLSKTEKKKAALALQDLGEQLVALSVENLNRIDLSPDILEAVVAAKKITRHGPLNRQLQYIGSLMRKCDPEPIREFLDALKKGTTGKARK